MSGFYPKVYDVFSRKLNAELEAKTANLVKEAEDVLVITKQISYKKNGRFSIISL